MIIISMAKQKQPTMQEPKARRKKTVLKTRRIFGTEIFILLREFMQYLGHVKSAQIVIYMRAMRVLIVTNVLEFVPKEKTSKIYGDAAAAINSIFTFQLNGRA